MKEAILQMRIIESIDNFQFYLAEKKLYGIDFISLDDVIKKFEDLFGDFSIEPKKTNK